MKKETFFKIAITLITIAPTFGCGNNKSPKLENSTSDNAKVKTVTISNQNLENRPTKLTFEEVAGTWKGSGSSYTECKTEAVKLILNNDGTFTATFFCEGTPWDSESGTFVTTVKETKTTDPYGENKNSTYEHTIKFNSPNAKNCLSFTNEENCKNFDYEVKSINLIRPAYYSDRRGFGYSDRFDLKKE